MTKNQVEQLKDTVEKQFPGENVTGQTVREVLEAMDSIPEMVVYWGLYTENDLSTVL